MTDPAPRTAVIVDDHAIFRSGLRADLDPDRLAIVGEAGDVDEAVRTVLELAPDVVLLDVHLPGGAGGGGAEVAERVLARRPAQRFLALSVSDAAEDVVAVIRAGARGYITKTASGAEVADAAGTSGAAAPDEDLDRLSAREREVMRLIARGYTYREAGAELFISDRTVETHVSSVLRKLQLSNRHELTRWAARRGYA